MQVAIGLDLGGTNLKYGLVTKRGEVLEARSTPSRTAEGVRGVLASLRFAVRDLQAIGRAAGHQIVAAGLGLPGTVCGRQGMVLTAPPQIPGIQGLKAGASVRNLAKVKVAVENDATVAALAEARVGSGRGAASLLLVTVGTGVGGGLVIGGQLVRGRYGTGGEIGHGVFAPGGLSCGHGGRGCLELYCSATALVRIHAELGGAAGLDPREIARRAARRDRIAAKAFDIVGTNLGLGLATAGTLVAPEIIAVGGGLADAGKLLMDPLRRAFTAQVLPYVAHGCRIVRARLKNRAGLIGAALLAIEDGQ